MIGAITGAVSAGIGVVSALKNGRKMRRLRQEMERNRTHRLNQAEDEYNEATGIGNTEAEQQTLTDMDDATREASNRANGQQLVNGATSEARATQMQGINDTRRRMLGNINAQRTSRKQMAHGARQAVRSQVYSETQSDLSDQMGQAQQATQQAMQGIQQGISSIASDKHDNKLFDKWFGE